jgi:diguanylate cyclase (GGDEF)-like protein
MRHRALRRWLLILLAVSFSQAALAFVIKQMHEPVNPQAQVDSCAGFGAGEGHRVRIEAPMVGWDGRPVAVTVSGAGVDWLRISQGSRVFCGRFGDGQQMDSRFRTAVGGVFVPPAGGSEPIEVMSRGIEFPFWPAVVSHGPPATLQQLDAQRFAFRIAVLAISLSIVVSTALAYLAVRDIHLLLFAINTLLMSGWIALVTGLSGFPEAWLPAGELRARLQITLPLLVAASMAYQMVLFGRHGSSRGLLLAMRAGCLLLAGVGLLALVLPVSVLVALSVAAEVAVLALFAAVLLAAGSALLRGSESARSTLLSCLPITLAVTVSLLAPDAMATWKTEVYIACAVWISINGSARLMLRLGSLREQRDAMRLLAETDSLTGLSNRRGALAQLEAELLRSEADGIGFGLIFVDIDHFKQINDSFGHSAGDFVLVAVAQLLKQVVRTSDAVARMGGEEFLLILPGADQLTSQRLAENIRQRIETLPLAGSGPEAPLACTASLGVLCSQDHPKVGASELLRRVDGAMYSAKHDGRNRVALAV